VKRQTKRTKHGPGPWTFDGDRVHDADGNTVARRPLAYDWDADARLIAAAPDLLAMVHRYRDSPPGQPLPDAEAAALIARIYEGTK
jgi:hypothetical protein